MKSSQSAPAQKTSPHSLNAKSVSEYIEILSILDILGSGGSVQGYPGRHHQAGSSGREAVGWPALRVAGPEQGRLAVLGAAGSAVFIVLR